MPVRVCVPWRACVHDPSPHARTIATRARRAAIVVGIAMATVVPTELASQRVERVTRRAVVDSTCLTGRACRLAIVEGDDGRRFGSGGLVLRRGVGRDAYIIGPVWERITVTVGADPTAAALAREAFAARGRARHRTLLVDLASTVVAMAAGAVFIDRAGERFGLATIVFMPLVAAPAGVLTAVVLAPWAHAGFEDAQSTLEDAVGAWNHRVDPPVP